MIGTALANRLLERNHNVIAIIRQESSKIEELNSSPNLSIIQCNMEDYCALDKIIEAQDDEPVRGRGRIRGRQGGAGRPDDRRHHEPPGDDRRRGGLRGYLKA